MDLEGQPVIVDACQRVRRRTLNEDDRFSHSYLLYQNPVTIFVIMAFD